MKLKPETPETVKVRLQDSNGRVWHTSVTPEIARRLKELSGEGTMPRLSVDSTGSVVNIVGVDADDALRTGLDRFELKLPPFGFDLFVSEQWEKWLRQWVKLGPRGRWILLHSPPGTGKDTILNILIHRIKEKYAEVVVLTPPAEFEHRFVGHQETKPRDLAQLVQLCKELGYVVVVYLPELESIFASGDHNASHEIRYKAAFRNILDGTIPFEPDFVLATANNLYRVGAPTISRFRTYLFPMETESVRGMLKAHWPKELLNGASCDHVVGRLTDTKVADVIHTSQKKVALRMVDLSALNGRFLRDFAHDLREQIELRRDDDPGFEPDAAFLDELLAEHIEPVTANLAEAVGTRALREFVVEAPDPFDPPVDVQPTLDWCDESVFVS